MTMKNERRSRWLSIAMEYGLVVLMAGVHAARRRVAEGCGTQRRLAEGMLIGSVFFVY